MARQSTNAVGVWYYQLDGEKDLGQAWSVLDPDERARADRLRFESGRRRFILAHGAVRTLLARYLDLDPAALRFEYGVAGKPRLATDAADDIHFNASDSGGLGMLAVRRGAPLGVDVEQVRAVDDLPNVAQRYFAAPEKAWIDGFHGEVAQDAFYRVWTCKEAYLKARGIGLGADLDGFAFDFATPERPTLRYCKLEGAYAGEWDFVSLQPVSGYRACVAGKHLGRIGPARAFAYNGKHR